MILETFSDNLFNKFIKKIKTAKELWDAVVKVYKGEAAGTKKFYVQSYREFKMVDSKPILEQAKDFQKIANAITIAGMFLDPIFHVNGLISILPSSWQEYKTKLMHEQDDMKLDTLMHHLRVEELIRKKGKKPKPTKNAHIVKNRPKD